MGELSRSGKTFKIKMKIILSISLILVSATSYVQSDGHGHHGHHVHQDHQNYHPYYAYERQSSGYDAPAPSYDTPSTGYDSPSTGYGAEPIGYGEEDSFPDLTPFLTLSLVILGLSLLFPAIVTITDVNTDTDNTDGMIAMDDGKRKRRYADENQASRTNFVG